MKDARLRARKDRSDGGDVVLRDINRLAECQTEAETHSPVLESLDNLHRAIDDLFVTYKGLSVRLDCVRVQEDVKTDSEKQDASRVSTLEDTIREATNKVLRLEDDLSRLCKELRL